MKTLKTWIMMGAACAWASGSLGQTKEWDKRFGGSASDQLSSVIPTADGGYLLGGTSSSGDDGDKLQPSRGLEDFWIVKTSASGIMQWNARYGGAAGEYLEVVLQTPDGGYLLGGSSLSGADGDKTEASRGNYDFWIVRVDAFGNKLWDRRFGGAASDILKDMQRTADGGYILGGYTTSGEGGDKSQASRGSEDYWIVKVDPYGNKMWDRRFGGADGDRLGGLQQTADGGYILGGHSSSGISGDKSEASRGNSDYWIVKTDAFGNREWDRRFGGTSAEWGESVQQTADGGYILGGTSLSLADGDKTEGTRGAHDFWVVKVDAGGVRQWDRRFGGDHMDWISQVRPAAGGGYILGGFSMSEATGDKSETSRGSYDYWLVKISAGGVRQWDRRFGGTVADQSLDVLQTADGGYLMAGLSMSEANFDRTQSSRGSYDYWIVKVGVRPPDAYEADSSAGLAKTIANGVVQARSIHEPGDIDWAKFVVGAAGARNVRIETSGTAGDTELWVYQGVGGPLAGSNGDISAANKFSRVTLAALAAGTYYIKVGAYGNNTALAAYSLRARWTQNYAPDRYEPDNRRTAARRIRNGKTQNRTIHRAGNRDWAKFTVGSRGARKVVIQTSGASGDTVMRLYNRAGKRLAIDDNSGPGRFSRIRKATLPAGTYTLRIEEKGNNGTLPAYQLYIRWRSR